MPQEKTFKGRCFCGAVELQVTGGPVAAGYCHCASCREWSAGPVNAFTLWPPSALSITRGLEHVGTYNKTERSARKWCKRCGGHLLTEHPHWGLVDVYAAVLADFPFEPQVHVNYAETVLHLHDGLPKQQDVPKDQLIKVLYWIALHPTDGEDSAIKDLWALKFSNDAVDPEQTRERAAIYGVKLLGRLLGKLPGGPSL